MRKDITVTAEVRTTRGKNEARRLRVRGFIPAVLYGAYKDSVAVGLNPKELTKILNSNTGHNTIFNLAIEGGENTPVMVVDSQRDPIKGIKRHPDIGDHVTIYPGANVLGGKTVVGANSIIGSNVWLMKSVPANSVVYYQGEAISVVRSRRTKAGSPDLGTDDMANWDI